MRTISPVGALFRNIGAAAAPSSDTATGLFALPLDNLRTLLANSANFQTWTGTASAAAAKARIHLVAVNAGATRPYAVITHLQPADLRRTAIAGGASQKFIYAGAMMLAFEDDVATGDEDSHESAQLAFINTVGAIISDMETLAGSGAYLVVTEMSVDDGPARAHPDEKSSGGDYYWVSLRVEYGI